MFQISGSSPVYDVVIIGSGAGGGTVTKSSPTSASRSRLLEAGPPLDPAKDFKEHMWPYQVSHRGIGERRARLLRSHAVGLWLLHRQLRRLETGG